MESPAFAPSAGIAFWQSLLAVVLAACLAAGLWTPVCALLATALESWMVYSASGESRVTHLLAAGMALGLAVLGPGALSLDARLFGRKRLPMDGRR